LFSHFSCLLKNVGFNHLITAMLNLSSTNNRVSVIPSGFIISVVGYSEKMPAVLEAVTSRIMSLLVEMKEGPEQHPALAERYIKAMQNLARETKNFRLDSPLAIASYNSRMLLENPVWHIEQYIAEMEGEVAVKKPLTMTECALIVEEAITGRVAVSFSLLPLHYQFGFVFLRSLPLC
jgi:hypothetical protein